MLIVEIPNNILALLLPVWIQIILIKTFFNKLLDKMVANVDLLGPGTCTHILHHENSSSIIHANNHWQWTINLISFAASNRATNSALLDDRGMFLCTQLFQLIGTPIKKTQNPATLILVLISPAQLLSENTILSKLFQLASQLAWFWAHNPVYRVQTWQCTWVPWR